MKWFSRPVTIICVFLICLVVAFAALRNIQLGPSGSGSKITFSIIIRHYGIDSEEMERSISKPLEDSLSILPKLEELRSTSEYGMSRIELTVDDKSSESFLFIRDIVDRFYITLPKSVQKPQIFSSSSNQSPVFIIAFEPGMSGLAELRDFVEHQIKPSFENLPGVGEVQIGGGEIREIHILADTLKLAGTGINFSSLASYLQSNHVQAPVGLLSGKEIDMPVLLKGELNSLEAIRNLQIPLGEGKFIDLRNIADVSYGYRAQDSIGRVNGEQKVILYIKNAGSANIIAVCKKALAESEKWKDKGFSSEIILNSGKEMEDSIYSVFQAILIGICIVCLVLTPFQKSVRNSVLLGIGLPIVALFTAAVLTAFAISLDHFILAGIAVSIGMVIDSGIVVSEQINETKKISSMKTIIPPIITSALTTVIVMVPLFFLNEQVNGIKQLALAISLIITLSVFLNLFFLPPFLKIRKKKSPSQSKLIKTIIKLPGFFVKKPKWGIILACIILAVGIITLISINKNISIQSDGKIIRAHIEYESGASAFSVDSRTRTFTASIQEIPGITRIESDAKRDNCRLSIIYDPNEADVSDIKKQVKALGENIPGGFLYLPEKSSNDTLTVEISVTGSENTTLRTIAKNASKALSSKNWVSQAVMHFKDPPVIYTFTVDQKKAAMNGLSTAAVSDNMRWALQGPVAVKWKTLGREMDLRIMGTGNKDYNTDDLSALTLPSKDNKVSRNFQLGQFSEATQDARIFRKNRQRSISFSIQIKNEDIFESYQKIRTVLDSIAVPEGYAFEIDKTILENQRYFKQLYLILILAVVIIYMLLAAQSESLIIPLKILSIVPVSLTFPLVFLWISGSALTLAGIVGLIILTGMNVNNSILIIDKVKLMQRHSSNRLLVLLAVKQRLRPLLLTSITTIMGTLPMFFFKSSGLSILQDLAMIMFWGTLGSLLMTLTFIPALLTKKGN